MSWKDYSEPITVMEKKLISDGMGGYEVEWHEGITFEGVINTANTIEVQVAEKEGVKAVYVLLFPNVMPLDYGDILLSNNRYFKVATNPEDGKPPRRSRLDFIQVKLEPYNMV